VGLAVMVAEGDGFSVAVAVEAVVGEAWSSVGSTFPSEPAQAAKMIPPTRKAKIKYLNVVSINTATALTALLLFSQAKATKAVTTF
jgi:hypothetical protein